MKDENKELIEHTQSWKLEALAADIFEELRMRNEYPRLKTLADNILGYASDAELKCEYWNRTRDEQ